ncbi:MAG: hypothetical protein EBY42_08715, partial [Actinobacteria bacterium]|nr:hypothetical protein [Actinomycetota bacterium]
MHDLDIASWIADSPIEFVQATRAIRGAGDFAEFDDADVTKIIATTESGIPVSISGARHDARGQDVRIEVFGSKDSVSAGITPRTPLVALDGPEIGINTDVYTGFIDRFREAFRAETTAFVDLIGGAPNPCPPQAALEALGSSTAGLSSQEVRARQQRHGLNRLQLSAGRSRWRILADQFSNVMLLMLLAVAAVSGAAALHQQEFPKDAIAILVIVLLNALLGYLQESKAQQALLALRNLAQPLVQ